MTIQEQIDKAGTLMSGCGSCGSVFATNALRWHGRSETWRCFDCFDALGKIDVIDSGKVSRSSWSAAITLAQALSVRFAEHWAQGQRDERVAQAANRDRLALRYAPRLISRRS